MCRLVTTPCHCWLVCKGSKDRDSNDIDLVFPGRDVEKPLSDMSLTVVMRRMGLARFPMGFRSTFTDWCADNQLPKRGNVRWHWPIQSAMTEAAYRRGDLFDKRRNLMDDWAKFIAMEPVKANNVVKLARTLEMQTARTPTTYRHPSCGKAARVIDLQIKLRFRPAYLSATERKRSTTEVFPPGSMDLKRHRGESGPSLVPSLEELFQRQAGFSGVCAWSLTVSIVDLTVWEA